MVKLCGVAGVSAAIKLLLKPVHLDFKGFKNG